MNYQSFQRQRPMSTPTYFRNQLLVIALDGAAVTPVRLRTGNFPRFINMGINYDLSLSLNGVRARGLGSGPNLTCPASNAFRLAGRFCDGTPIVGERSIEAAREHEQFAGNI